MVWGVMTCSTLCAALSYAQLALCHPWRDRATAGIPLHTSYQRCGAVARHRPPPPHPPRACSLAPLQDAVGSVEVVGGAAAGGGGVHRLKKKKKKRKEKKKKKKKVVGAEDGKKAPPPEPKVSVCVCVCVCVCVQRGQRGVGRVPVKGLG